jgi:hypothetical protein
MSPVENAPLDFDAVVREVSLDIDAIIRTGHSRRRRRRYATAMTAVVIAIAGTTLVVSNFPHTAASGSQTLSATGTIPCNTPTRTVPDYLSWPCATGPVTPYFQGQINDAASYAQSAHIDAGRVGPQQPITHARVRVLAFGTLPNSTAGSTLTVVEYWQAGGHSPAQLFATVSGTHDPGGGDGTSGLVPVTGDPAVFSIPANWFPPKSVTSNQCEYLVNHPPTPPNEATATCTRTVVARAGVAAVRLLRGPGHPDAAVQVHHNLAGIFQAPLGTPHLSQWRIQALDSNGHIISSVPYNAIL